MPAEVVVVTASPGTFVGLAERLNQPGIRVEEQPLIGFEAPESWAGLDAAVSTLNRFNAVALTSPRAAHAFAERLRLGDLSGSINQPVIWAIGQGTARALGYLADQARLLKGGAGGSPAAALARAMLAAGCQGPVLFPCGETHRDELPSILRAGGCEVEEVVCYRSVLASRAQAEAAAARASLLVVTSPRVMQLLVDSCPSHQRPRLVAIGSTTAASAQASGWRPDAVAGKPSTGGVASAITRALAGAGR
jgi:uroporphyrinogen-III synthase